MNFTLAPELEEFIQAQVESGRYPSANDVVSAALRLLQARCDTLQPLHARVDGALAALTRGEGAEGEAYIENRQGDLEQSQEEERPLQR